MEEREHYFLNIYNNEYTNCFKETNFQVLTDVCIRVYARTTTYVLM